MSVESFFFPCPKQKRFQSKTYLCFVVSGRPCCACGQLRTDYIHVVAHHFKTKGSGGADLETVPLCTACHHDVHFVGRKTFEQKNGIDFVSIQLKLLEEFIEFTYDIWEGELF